MWMQGAVTDEDKLDADEAKRIVRRAYRMLGDQRRRMWLALALIAVYTSMILAGPYLVKFGIDEGIVEGDKGVLYLAVGLYVVVALVQYASQRSMVLVLSQVGEGFLRDLREKAFHHLQRLSMPFYDREKGGVIVSRLTSDVDSMQELVQMGLLMLVSNVLLLVLAIGVLAAVSWQLMLVCLVSVPPVLIASRKFRRDSNDAYLEVRDRIGSTLSDLQEGIAGVRVTQAYGREQVEADRFSRGNRSLYGAHLRSVKIQAWYLPVIEFAGLGTTALVVGVGGWMVTQDMVTVGTVAFFVLTLSNLFDPIQQLSQLFNQIQSAGAGLRKVLLLLDEPVDVPERPDAVELPARGDIEVDGLAFRYGRGMEWVLHDVALTIPDGERLALVGPTGAGKSTLAKLIARFYDPVEGAVRFGGVDLRDATHESLRRRVVVVPQEGFLFNATIRDNIRVARAEATDDEVVAALDAIGIRERFEALPAGLDTEVDERGSRLSAGEKQLVSLARAALVDPGVLVLDEATSSLDPGTEMLVEAAMERLMQGRTVIVIAHRLSTSERADRVGVVTGGSLAEVGTHDELVAAGGHYAALFATWQGGLTSAGADATPGG
ncbi:MAG TPA: ABC transporter ATP-binding protein [Acidimicrobiales bacterium]|nr:ABC transporter ATP-binding protein [Acidimicrobiales bacterium]